MKLKNVFYGFTKDGDRKLLWKKYISEYTPMGPVDRTRYYDLEDNKYIETKKVDEKSLIPITELVGSFKRMSKRKIKKSFKADNELLFDAKEAFYGDIVYKKNGKEALEIEDVLFARISEPQCRVQRVKNGKLYPWSERINSGIAVREVRPIKNEQFEEVVVTKKKLLESDYRKEL